MIHHNISQDIPEAKRNLVRKAYINWWLHSWCLVWNMVCETGALVVGYVFLDFFWALIAFVIGPTISFMVYLTFYSAVRKSSAFYFVLWFVLFVLQIAAEFWFAIGIAGMGSAGLVMMIELFGGEKMALGIMFLISTFFWGVTGFFSIYIFFEGRKEYKNAGGGTAATREFGKVAITAAYDNRETVKQVIVDNKEAIKQVVVDNKDVLKQVVVDNKDTIYAVAKDHKKEILQAAVENKDVINPWENAEVMNSVFDSKSNP